MKRRVAVESKLKKITMGKLKELTHVSIHARLEQSLKKEGVDYLVLFENQQFDSSEFGKRSILSVGPTCTYKTLEEVAKGHLGNVPSRFQYPVSYVEKERIGHA